jgi:hypothetical protein
METTITREELALLVRALENREFKYTMIKDIHKYLLDKIDECAKLENAKTQKSAKDKKPMARGLTPPHDSFVD